MVRQGYRTRRGHGTNTIVVDDAVCQRHVTPQLCIGFWVTKWIVNGVELITIMISNASIIFQLIKAFFQVELRDILRRASHQLTCRHGLVRHVPRRTNVDLSLDAFKDVISREFSRNGECPKVNGKNQATRDWLISWMRGWQVVRK
jgi:hypothetical protein